LTSVNAQEGDEGYVSKRYNFYDGQTRGKKKYVVYTYDDLRADFYTESEGLIHQVLITGIADAANSTDFMRNTTVIRVIFEPAFSEKGYIEVSLANAKIIETYMTKVPKRVPIENAKSEADNNTTTDEKTTDQTTTTGENNTNEQSSDSEGSTEDTQNTSENTQDTSEEILTSTNITNSTSEVPKYTTIYEEVPKNRTRSNTLTISEIFHGLQPLTTAQKLSATAHLVDLEKRDKLILDTLKAKNDYETLIYSSRSWIQEEDNLKYTTQEVKEKFLEELNEAENWIYEDGFDETLQVYTDRINHINDTINPIKFRKHEHEVREDVMDGIKRMVANFTEEIEEFHKHFPWIDEKKVETLLEFAKNSTKWFNDKVEEQEKMALNEDPVLTSKDLKERILSIPYALEKWSKIRKPRDWDKKQKEKEERLNNPTNSTESDSQTENESKNEEPSNNEYQEDEAEYGSDSTEESEGSSENEGSESTEDSEESTKNEDSENRDQHEDL
jgi:hypothetical protein